MWPISVDRTHCVVRVYWLGKDKSASMRFAREFAVGFLMGIHSEDIELIEMNHRGISSGALETMPLQSQEALCRHFFNNVEHAVNDYLGERRQGDHVDA
jgi:phenylpropionate dioxygenase-like ring-hydroxylating dioxygenase large terminal subunit